MKIEIKSRFTANVLFSFECESNSIKLTLQAALKDKANLRGADLYGANLRGADLRDANLRGADLYGANLRGEKLTKTPLFLYNLMWDVTVTAESIKIGCQHHKIEAWRNFNDDQISEMHCDALSFWNKHKTAIMALADVHKAD